MKSQIQKYTCWMIPLCAVSVVDKSIELVVSRDCKEREIGNGFLMGIVFLCFKTSQKWWLDYIMKLLRTMRVWLGIEKGYRNTFALFIVKK